MPKKTAPKLDYDRIAKALGAKRLGRWRPKINHTKIAQELTKFSGRSLTARQVAKYLGMRICDVRRLRDVNKLLSVIDDPLERYPAWQFGNGRPLPGLCRVLRALAKNGQVGWDAMLFLVTESTAIGGLSPLDKIKAGAWQDAERLARRAGKDEPKRPKNTRK